MSEKQKKLFTIFANLLFLSLSISAFYTNSIWVLFTSHDTGWLIRIGQYIFEHGLPYSNIFALSLSNQVVFSYQWLFECFLAKLFDFGSLWFVGFIICIFVGILNFFILPLIWMRKKIPLCVSLLTILLVQTPHWYNARPQIFSFYFILLLISILENNRKNKENSKLLYLFPVFIALWANIHSFFLIGLFIISVYYFVSLFKTKSFSLKYFLIYALSLIAPLFNPYGFGLFTYLMSFFNSSQYMNIWELQAWINSKEYMWTLLFIPLSWYFLLAQRIKHKNNDAYNLVCIEGLIIVGFATLASLCMRRFEPVYVLTSWIYLGDALAEVKWNKLFSETKPKTLGVILQFILAILIPYFVWKIQCPTMSSAWMVYTGDAYPLIKLVNQHQTSSDRLFHAGPEGSWLIALGKQNVFIDTRYDAYPKKFVEKVDDCLQAKNSWQSQLEEWKINQVLINDNTLLYQQLLISPQWHIILDDGVLSWWFYLKNEDDLAKLLNKLSLWKYADTDLSSKNLPEHINKATVETRSMKHLAFAKYYASKEEWKNAVKEIQNGLVLIPDSSILKEKLEIYGKNLVEMPNTGLNSK